MVDLAETYSPCPFATYKIPARQAWQVLRIFFIYRFSVACLFSGLFFFKIGPSILGYNNPVLYSETTSTYLLIAVVQGICLFLKKPSYSVQAQLQIFTDFIGLILIMHGCGGIETGIGTLLAVSVASAGLLVGGRCALGFAALATVLILAEQVYSDLTNTFERTAYTYAGMLGASFFTISLLALVLADRAEENAAIAAQQSVDIANLQQLNEYVIQHLQLGIVVLDRENHVIMMNGAALRLFNLSSKERDLHTISPELNRDYYDWFLGKPRDSTKLKIDNGSDINVRYIRLGENNNTFHMIFLEDRALSNQRVQQSKLASLGRLAASIAHEIRNPLGAISHASQLLAESPTRSEEDIRLTEIIRNHTGRVNKIIENVLQISRRKPSQTESLELVSWLERFLLEFTSENQLSTLPFKLKNKIDQAHASVDSGHLKQILDNLCNNAMKHGKGSQEGNVIEIFRKNGCFCIAVEDRGPGISMENIESIFEPFFTTSNSGTGLGLYISRELAELNRASLEYQPLSGGGSCFQLCLPNAEARVIAV